jgi:DNA polymerase elongation subunit (family B)
MKSAVGYEYRDLDGQQAATKRLANSLYGLWNTQGLGFNDPYAGAAITAYGRQLARYMIKFAVDRGCDCVAIDTDGALFRIAPHIVGNYPDIDSKIKFFAELTADLNAKLPGTTAVEFEDYIPSLYIPPSDKSGAATVLARKIEFLDSRVKPDDLSPGLSKNYLMTTLDRGRYEHTGEFVTKMVRKGKFKKRDKSWLEAGMIIAWFEVYNSSGNEAASKFLDDVRAQIASGAFPVENLRKTVLVAATWKAFPAAGFPVGTKPTIHYAWLGETTGVRNKKVYTPVADPAIPYALEYYLEVFDKVTSAIPGYAAKPSSSSISLPLFSIDITV